MKSAYAIVGARVVTPLEVFAPGVLITRGERILWVGPQHAVSLPADCEVIDARGLVLTPGFIDIHVHGAQGRLFSCAKNIAEFSEMATALQNEGTTTFFAAIGSLGPSTKKDLLMAAKACRRAASGAPMRGAEMAGLYLEGPYLSPKKPGVSRAFTGSLGGIPDPVFVCELLDAAGGLARLVVVAPEIECAREIVRTVVDRGVIASIGHTDAGYDLTNLAIDDWGMRHATHTFNAMRGLHHREPGTVGALLTQKHVVTEIIADGVHVHPAAIRVLLKSRPREKVVLVSDGCGLGGMPSGRYVVPCTDVPVYIDGIRCTLDDGTMAGSVCPMNRQIEFLVRACGITLAHAVQLATLNPAIEFSMVDRGSLSPGKNADMVLMDSEYRVVTVFQRGVPRQIRT